MNQDNRHKIFIIRDKINEVKRCIKNHWYYAAESLLSDVANDLDKMAAIHPTETDPDR